MPEKEEGRRLDLTAAEKHARSIIMLGVPIPGTTKRHTDQDIIDLFGFEPTRWHDVRASFLAPPVQKTSLNPIPTPKFEKDFGESDQDSPREQALTFNNNGNGTHPEPGVTLNDAVKEGNVKRAGEQLATKDRLHPSVRMLFIGAAMGGYQITPGEGSSKKIYMETKADKDKPNRRLLRDVLSKYGQISFDEQVLRVSFDAEKFSFLKNPGITRDELERQARFGPFTQGLLTARTVGANRFSHPDSGLVLDLNKCYEFYYGETLGNVTVEHRTLRVINLRNIEAIMQNLTATSKNAGFSEAQQVADIFLSSQAEKSK